jgi:hypothetical protein
MAVGCAEEGRIFDAGFSETLHITLHSLVDGDYISIKLHIPENHRPVWINLARVIWAEAGRFGVELLIMDSDERVRLGQFIGDHLSLELEFHDAQSELIITAAE